MKTMAAYFLYIIGSYITDLSTGVLSYNKLVNPYLTNGFYHHYHLGESTFIFRGVRSDF